MSSIDQNGFVCESGLMPCSQTGTDFGMPPVCVESLDECPVTGLMVLDNAAYLDRKTTLVGSGYSVDALSENTDDESMLYLAVLRANDIGLTEPLS